MIARPKAAAIPVSPKEPPRSLFTTIAPHPANTRANVATASATQRRTSEGLGKELDEKLLDALVDLVADLAHGLQILPRRIF